MTFFTMIVKLVTCPAEKKVKKKLNFGLDKFGVHDILGVELGLLFFENSDSPTPSLKEE